MSAHPSESSFPSGFPSSFSPAPSESLYPSGAPSEWITGPQSRLATTRGFASAGVSVRLTITGFVLLILVYTCMGAWGIAFATKKNKNPNFTLALFSILFALPSAAVLPGILQDKFELVFTILMLPPVALSIIKIIAVFISFRRIRARRLPITTQLEATNTFEDMTSPTFRTFLIGMVQFVLMLLYVAGIRTTAQPEFDEGCDYDNPIATCTKKTSYVYYYCLGVFVQVGYVIGTDQWKSNVDSVEFWANAFHAVFADGTWEPEPSIGNTSRLVLFCRFFYSTVVNTTGLVSIILLLPLQVAVGDPEVVPLDFVLNVVAAFYIIEMDDLSEPQAFSVRFRAPPSEMTHDVSFQQSKITSYLLPRPTTTSSQRMKHSNVIEEEGSPDMLGSDGHQGPHANTTNNDKNRQPKNENYYDGKQNETKNGEKGDIVNQDSDESEMFA
jgi:hypothetical protein